MNISIASFADSQKNVPSALYGQFNFEAPDIVGNGKIVQIDEESVLKNCTETASGISNFLKTLPVGSELLPHTGITTPAPIDLAVRILAVPLPSASVKIIRSGMESFIEYKTEINFGDSEAKTKLKLKSEDIRNKIYNPLQVLAGCPLSFFKTSSEAKQLGFLSAHDVDKSIQFLITLMHQKDIQTMADFCLNELILELNKFAVRCGLTPPPYKCFSSSREDLKYFYEFLRSDKMGTGATKLLVDIGNKVAKIINPSNEQFTFFSTKESFLKDNLSNKLNSCAEVGIGFSKEANAFREANLTGKCEAMIPEPDSIENTPIHRVRLKQEAHAPR